MRVMNVPLRFCLYCSNPAVPTAVAVRLAGCGGGTRALAVARWRGVPFGTVQVRVPPSASPDVKPSYIKRLGRRLAPLAHEPAVRVPRVETRVTAHHVKLQNEISGRFV